MGLKEFKQNLAENSESNNSGSYEKRPYAKLKPEVIICFNEISNMHMFMDLMDNGNPVEDPCAGQGSGNLLLTIEQPQVISGSLFAAQGRDQGDISRESDLTSEYVDYMLCDSDNEGYELSYDSTGDLKGVSPNSRSNIYSGKPVDGFMEDTIDLQLGGRSARRIARTLDVNGRFPAGYHDGEFNNGFIENNPNDPSDDDATYKRPTRFPQMRDIEWEDNGGGFIVLMDASDINPDWSGHHITLSLNDFDGDKMENATMVEPVHNPEMPEYDSKLYWTDVSDGPNGELDDDTGDDQDFPSNPLATEGDDSSGINIESLSQHEREFVEGVVENSEVYPGQNPVDDLLDGDWDKWEKNVNKYYQGTKTVDEAFCEDMNEACAAYANMVQLDQ